MTSHYDSILGLRAIRQFEDRPVSDADLRAILEAARWTGSSKNSQRWAFIVITDPDQKTAIAAAGDYTTPVMAAPMLIALVETPGGYEFDTGRVAQNIMLAADAIGLATCPVTLHREELARQVLHLPEDHRCRYGVVVGYPAPSSGPARFGGRKPIGQLVHRNWYGG